MMATMNSIYKKNFTFKANRFEEYVNGQCTRKGLVDAKISAQTFSFNGMDGINMRLSGTCPSRINPSFGFPILGVEMGDVLEDRIQYGRIPDSFSWNDSNDPVVCNIFNNMQCIRFAMLSPLRIMEFYGEFVNN